MPLEPDFLAFFFREGRSLLLLFSKEQVLSTKDEKLGNSFALRDVILKISLTVLWPSLLNHYGLKDQLALVVPLFRVRTVKAERLQGLKVIIKRVCCYLDKPLNHLTL